jgi:hypothetical protein
MGHMPKQEEEEQGAGYARGLPYRCNCFLSMIILKALYFLSTPTLLPRSILKKTPARSHICCAVCCYKKYSPTGFFAGIPLVPCGAASKTLYLRPGVAKFHITALSPPPPTGSLLP